MRIEINLDLTAETQRYIRDEASRRGLPESAIVAEVLEEVIEDYYREPTKAELLEGLRQGLIEALSQELDPVVQAV